MKNLAINGPAGTTLLTIRLFLRRNRLTLLILLACCLLLPWIALWSGKAQVSVEYAFTQATSRMDWNSRKSITPLFLHAALKEHAPAVQQGTLAIYSENDVIRFKVRAARQEQADLIAAAYLYDLSDLLNQTASAYFEGNLSKLVLVSQDYADLAAAYRQEMNGLQTDMTENSACAAILEQMLADVERKQAGVNNRIDTLNQMLADVEVSRIRSAVSIHRVNLQTFRHIAAFVCFLILALLIILFGITRETPADRGDISL